MFISACPTWQRRWWWQQCQRRQQWRRWWKQLNRRHNMITRQPHLNSFYPSYLEFLFAWLWRNVFLHLFCIFVHTIPHYKGTGRSPLHMTESLGWVTCDSIETTLLNSVMICFENPRWWWYKITWLEIRHMLRLTATDLSWNSRISIWICTLWKI